MSDSTTRLIDRDPARPEKELDDAVQEVALQAMEAGLSPDQIASALEKEAEKAREEANNE